MRDWNANRYGLVYIPLLDWSTFLPRNLYTEQESIEYCAMVEQCHDAVTKYKDEHPEYMAARYYDVLKLADPELDRKVTEWSIDAMERRKKKS